MMAKKKWMKDNKMKKLFLLLALGMLSLDAQIQSSKMRYPADISQIVAAKRKLPTFSKTVLPRAPMDSRNVVAVQQIIHGENPNQPIKRSFLPINYTSIRRFLRRKYGHK